MLGVFRQQMQRCVANGARALDQTQVGYLQEQCVRVDENDNVVGHADKQHCHLWANIERGDALHRAFSVFTFDSHGRLLLQQRSAHKITFPLVWTNTCCSHPTATDDTTDVRPAAVRKMAHELGYRADQIEELHYITRVHYRARCAPPYNEWGEHEIDYCLLNVRNDIPPPLPNANEVADTRYVTRDELAQMFVESEQSGASIQFSPWFRLIADRFLHEWWAHLDDVSTLRQQDVIHSFTE